MAHLHPLCKSSHPHIDRLALRIYSKAAAFLGNAWLSTAHVGKLRVYIRSAMCSLIFSSGYAAPNSSFQMTPIGAAEFMR